MKSVPKYYNLCDESIYIVLRCFVDGIYTSIKELHPCLTKESNFETRKYVVKVGYVIIKNAIETMDENVIWTNPRVTEKGLNFLKEYSHFSNIYELGNNIKSE